MTIRAIAGLAVLNTFYLAIGLALLWAVRGWRSWGELVRLGGLAYLLGVASVSVVLTWAIVIGIPFGSAALLGCGGVLAGAAVAVGRALGRALPTFRRPSARLQAGALTVVAVGSLLALYFVALFRSARLAAPGEWDAWFVWTLRAKALYHGGDLGGSELVNEAHSAYPPALSLLQAAGFEAMGSMDAITLHLQHWFFALGFALALVGVLSERARPLVYVPFVVLILTMPIFLEWAISLYADLLLAFLAGLAVLLLGVWLEDRARWRLLVACALLGGALLTKREGLVVVACIVVACGIASWSERRETWPRLGYVALGAVSLSIPWWVASARSIEDTGPSSGLPELGGTIDRVWPSLDLVLAVSLDFAFSSGLAIIAVIAVLGLIAGARRLTVLMVSLAALAVVATTLVIASEPLLEFSRDQGINPVERLVMVWLVILAPLSPLLIEQGLAAGSRKSFASAKSTPRSSAPR